MGHGQRLAIGHDHGQFGLCRGARAQILGREAAVVHPPVDTDLYRPSDTVEEEYLWAGQLIPYKLPDVAVAAFTASGRKLHVVGTGPMLPRLRAMAGPGIRFSERLSFDDLRRAYATCKALVFTSEEDFGMIPVEVMASGRPVIAYGRGGALESVVDGRTGLFYTDKDEQGLTRALDEFEAWLPGFRTEDAVARARDFAPARFREAVARHVSEAMAGQREKNRIPRMDAPPFFLKELTEGGRAMAPLREATVAALP
jgi:glycosyltransferase involved in cell wall biosynthesis